MVKSANNKVANATKSNKVVANASTTKTSKGTSKGTANERRKMYKIRHQKDRLKKGTNGYYADQLLW